MYFSDTLHSIDFDNWSRSIKSIGIFYVCTNELIYTLNCRPTEKKFFNEAVYEGKKYRLDKVLINSHQFSTLSTDPGNKI